MCFVEDDNQLGFYIMLNMPFVVYALAFFYTYLSYGIKVKRITESSVITETE